MTRELHLKELDERIRDADQVLNLSVTEPSAILRSSIVYGLGDKSKIKPGEILIKHTYESQFVMERMIRELPSNLRRQTTDDVTVSTLAYGMNISLLNIIYDDSETEKIRLAARELMGRVGEFAEPIICAPNVSPDIKRARTVIDLTLFREQPVD